MIAKPELLLKYWINAVQTIVYIRNFISFIKQPKKIPTELWTR